MKKVLHIVYKSSNSVDYIYPLFFLKSKKKEYKISYLIWDFRPKHLIKNFPKKNLLNYKIYTFWNFLLFNLKSDTISGHFYFQRLYFRLINLFYFLINKKKLKNFLQSFDKIYMDCRELQSMPMYKNFCMILKSLNKEIIFVPHSAHYTNLIRETSDLHKQLFQGIKKKLIMSTKKSLPWKDTGGFKKEECIYLGLPSLNDEWLRVFKKLTQNCINKKTVGFAFRPFDRNFENRLLKFRGGDDYINTFSDNISFINIAKILNRMGYKISFRLHPSTKEDSFLKFYKKEISNLKFNFSRNTVHDFLSENHYIVSFNSSALIYACNYNKIIFLKENYLTDKVFKRWRLLKQMFHEFSLTFKDKNDFIKKFYNKKNYKKYNYKEILNKLW